MCAEAAPAASAVSAGTCGWWLVDTDGWRLAGRRRSAAACTASKPRWRGTARRWCSGTLTGDDEADTRLCDMGPYRP
jgi:hypothetical protein